MPWGLPLDAKLLLFCLLLAPQDFECAEVLLVASHDEVDEESCNVNCIAVDGDLLYAGVGPHVLVWRLEPVCCKYFDAGTIVTRGICCAVPGEKSEELLL